MYRHIVINHCEYPSCSRKTYSPNGEKPKDRYRRLVDRCTVHSTPYTNLGCLGLRRQEESSLSSSGSFKLHIHYPNERHTMREGSLIDSFQYIHDTLSRARGREKGRGKRLIYKWKNNTAKSAPTEGEGKGICSHSDEKLRVVQRHRWRRYNEKGI